MSEHEPHGSSNRTTCAGTRNDGQPCQSTLVLGDGYCVAHSRSKSIDRPEVARRAGIASGRARRALSKSARARLQEMIEGDEELYRKLRQAYIDALEATTSEGLPDYRGRVMAADALLKEAYGKPVQPMSGHEAVNIVITGMLPPRDTHMGEIVDADAVELTEEEASAGPALRAVGDADGNTPRVGGEA